MAGSKGSSGKASLSSGVKRRNAKRPGRRSGGRVMHGVVPGATPGRSGHRIDDGEEQGGAADWADGEFGPRQEAIAKNMRIIDEVGIAGAIVRVGGAEAGVNKELEGHGALEGVAKEADIPAGAPDGARRLVEAQVRHVKNAGPAAVRSTRNAIEWAIAITIVLQLWVDRAEFYVRDIAFAELQDIIESKEFRVLPGSTIDFTAFTINAGLKRYRGRPITLRVMPWAIHGEARATRYTLWWTRIRNVDIEWFRSPKQMRRVDECEVRLPHGTKVDLKGIHVTAYWDRLSWEQRRYLNSMRELLGGLEWA